jgi:hypothetical protein
MDDIDEDDPPKPPGKKLIKGTPTGVVYNERCNTCNHVARHTIDKMIVTPNISIREIARIYDLSHNSVANHAREHISYETQAIKNIIAHEAAQQQANIEDGVQGEMARNVFLRAYLQKATEALLNGDLNLSGKEAMATIDMLKKAEEEQFARQLEVLNAQMAAWIQAVKELVAPDIWYDILSRMKQILDEGETVFVEAEIVQDTPQQITSGL